MRNKLNTIEKIERYLNNEMEATEKELFEQVIASNTDLQQNIEAQQLLQRAIIKHGLKSDVIDAKNHYQKWVKIKLASIIVGSLALATMIAIAINTSNNMSNQSKIDKPKTDSSTHLIEKEAIKTDIQEIKETPKSESKSGSLLESLKKQSQYFSIDNSKPITITGKEGTILEIPANAFVDVQTGKPVNAEISFELKEYFKMKDLILNNLTTVSNGKLLESGGMIFTNAKSNDKILKLANGKSIQITFPNKNPKKGMNLFIGEQLQNQKVNWNKTGVSFNKTSSNKSITEFDEWNLGSTILSTILRINPKCYDCKKIIVENFNFPPMALKKNIQGKSSVQFSVNTDSSLSDFDRALYTYKLGYGIEDSIFSAIKKTGKWIPGSNELVPEKQTVTLTFEFKIRNKKVEITYPDMRFHTTPEDRNINAIRELLEDRKNPNRKKTRTQVYSNNSDVNYITSISQLGWSNCDRFYSKYGSTYVTVDDDSLQTFLIVEGKKTLTSSDTYVGNSRFHSVPVGEKITLLSFTENKGKIWLTIKTGIEVKQDLEIKMDNYQIVTKTELENILSKLE